MSRTPDEFAERARLRAFDDDSQCFQVVFVETYWPEFNDEHWRKEARKAVNHIGGLSHAEHHFMKNGLIVFSARVGGRGPKEGQT